MTQPATRDQTTFRLTYSVRRDLRAPPERVWALLTDADRLPGWNSAVSRLEGPIAPGSRLKIQVPLAPGRTFSPKVTTFEPHARMVWSDGFAPMFQGVRTFRLEPTADGTRFTMTEEFTGLFLPMIKASLPDFRAAFDTWAADLQREAER